MSSCPFSMIVKSITCRLFLPNQSLEEYVCKSISSLHDGDILVVTSKIVALAQGRIVPNTRGKKARIIKQESEAILKTRWCYLTLKDGHWCPNAGVDESNADGKLILWPEHSYTVAASLRKTLMRRYGIRRLGILITDSRTFPLRAGVTGVAVGYAGFKGLRDYRGKPDLFDRKLKMTQTNVADTLASAAVLLMGEGNERMPLAVIQDAPIVFTQRVNPEELRIDPKSDMYRPLFASLRK